MMMGLRNAVCALGSLVLAMPSPAAEALDKNYVRSLAAPGRTVLVIEYYDGKQNVVRRQGYAASGPFKALSGTDFRVHETMAIHLYGVAPCDGEMVNQRDGFVGRCEDYARQQLEIMLKNPKVIFCRAFISEEKAKVQNATCYGYHYFPGSLDSVSMFEEQLVSLGALRLEKIGDGSPARPDLMRAEQIGRKGAFGMWADPRTKEP
ncbi:hypothetical protein [Rhizobium terrae]|uniref:hypothetical protein n=1 Tax=Rhizobium terrae TaxID=2171756 RepID=UPI001D00DF45|nr:hypothetical protein [Rhizobium terrae]